MNNTANTRRMTRRIKSAVAVALATSLSLGLATTGANAATPRENTGVVGGAIAGAVAGGPVGLIAGAVIGGHYAGRSERLRSGERQAEALSAQLDELNAQLTASTLVLAQVETSLRERNARVAEQDARIASLAEDQLLLSALELRVRFATGDTTVSEDDHETLAILGRYLERHPEVRVRLEGHADGRGPAPDNLVLSRERAEAVGEVLEGARAGERLVIVLADRGIAGGKPHAQF
ncbi:MAG: OmpA family protein, partial [Pseudomonadota bacterium]